jgi:hypothetical protein
MDAPGVDAAVQLLKSAVGVSGVCSAMKTVAKSLGGESNAAHQPHVYKDFCAAVGTLVVSADADNQAAAWDAWDEAFTAMTTHVIDNMNVTWTNRAFALQFMKEMLPDAAAALELSAPRAQRLGAKLLELSLAPVAGGSDTDRNELEVKKAKGNLDSLAQVHPGCLAAIAKQLAAGANNAIFALVQQTVAVPAVQKNSALLEVVNVHVAPLVFRTDRSDGEALMGLMSTVFTHGVSKALLLQHGVASVAASASKAAGVASTTVVAAASSSTPAPTATGDVAPAVQTVLDAKNPTIALLTAAIEALGGQIKDKKKAALQTQFDELLASSATAQPEEDEDTEAAEKVDETNSADAVVPAVVELVCAVKQLQFLGQLRVPSLCSGTAAAMADATRAVLEACDHHNIANDNATLRLPALRAASSLSIVLNKATVPADASEDTADDASLRVAVKRLGEYLNRSIFSGDEDALLLTSAECALDVTTRLHHIGAVVAKESTVPEVLGEAYLQALLAKLTGAQAAAMQVMQQLPKPRRSGRGGPDRKRRGVENDGGGASGVSSEVLVLRSKLLGHKSVIVGVASRLKLALCLAQKDAGEDVKESDRTSGATVSWLFSGRN